MNKHLIIADQSLVNYMGHSFEYAHSIGDYAKSIDYQVTILGNQLVSEQVIKDINAIPSFKYGLDHAFDSPIFQVLPDNLGRKFFTEWNYRCHTKTLYHDLYNTEKRIDITSESIAIFHTIRHNHILPIVKWAEHIPKSRRPWFVLVFHFTAHPNFSHPSETAQFYIRALNYLETSDARDRFRLFTDSDELANEYRNYTNIPINVLPIPHATPPELLDHLKDEDDSPIPTRLTYMGDARINKGFHLLPYVFSKLGREFEDGIIEAELQANIRIPSEYEIELSITRMRQYKGVKLYETNLSSEDYYKLISRSGIILLPYTLDFYHSQTSGIFCEALAYGKPVIVPRGSWMAKQLKTYGSGITFIPEDRQSLYEAILTAIRQYKDLKTVALERSVLWRKIHCPSAYLKMIINSIA
jgi:glycosyltransferase involved in cell wall biosynthesis